MPSAADGSGEASVVEEYPHTGDDRRLLDQDSVVSDQRSRS
nr:MULTISPECIES: hypothetical protein [Frankia]